MGLGIGLQSSGGGIKQVASPPFVFSAQESQTVADFAYGLHLARAIQYAASSRLFQTPHQEWGNIAHAARYSVKKLANYNHTSVRTLQRQIVAMTGQSPHAWMRQFRMARAAQLLADDSKVEWVGAELGYLHRSHFARDFKKYWGYPPSEHARRLNLRR